MIIHVLLLLCLTIREIQCDWVDADTPKADRSTISLIDGSEYHLVMSDEFNVPNRTFGDGHDPLWTALDKSDDDMSAGGSGSLHFYNSSRVTTEDGFLKINTRIEKTEWTHYYEREKQYKKIVSDFASGMVQSWNKFCFTGGIVEIEVIFPGAHSTSGLWPAVWILGNLGRATYEASTNMVWPWSYDTCDEKLQHAQKISACNTRNHYGLNPNQGRGATEIDFLEIMSGPEWWLPSTIPQVKIPYASMTLQVAPGVPDNRPQFMQQPRWNASKGTDGQPPWPANHWYRHLEYQGDTSLNPFFYGQYLGETKPGEPVTRTKEQGFQADALSALHQITPENYKRRNKFRLEWQPGDGGRLDWFAQGYKVNETYSFVGDGNGTDWIKAFTILDDSLNDTMGSSIPKEPSSLIFNTAVSSTWGFPYDPPHECKRCYDCNDPNCACVMPNGFCDMLRNDTSFLIDSVRVYQSFDSSAHVGSEHTVGCDPVEFPTREYIRGNEYLFMRPAPWGYNDLHPLRPIEVGGAACDNHDDCGGVTRGSCIEAEYKATFLSSKKKRKTCKCANGFVGPRCLALDMHDDSPGAMELNSNEQILEEVAKLYFPHLMVGALVCLFVLFTSALFTQVRHKKVTNGAYTGIAPATPRMLRPMFRPSNQEPATEEERRRLLTITGRSV